MNVWNVPSMTSCFTAILRLYYILFIFVVFSSLSPLSQYHLILVQANSVVGLLLLSFFVSFVSSSTFHLISQQRQSSILHHTLLIFVKPGKRQAYRYITHNGVIKSDYPIYYSLIFPCFAYQPRPEETNIIIVQSSFNAVRKVRPFVPTLL